MGQKVIYILFEQVLCYTHIVQQTNLKESSMSIESHIESLNEKVNDLEGLIHHAYVHHLPTSCLKKQRLLYLDAIARLVKNHERVAA